ncbi:PTS beta-glucoside transporter subunit IIABC [Photobacterium leiognathi]|uniref:PTS sugar transporter subunit IIA n=1 Tax=Photobacterium leiognathi TaxID=553611 RepID=UPI000C029F09|nr:PTS sugar transporter subunit IIA [Photobacterium leiognathi]PHZ60158.1 PTS beta-glucoside transporter subunit IIABC [Photobacterium leiognathi]
MSLYDLIGPEGIVITSESNLSVDSAIDLACSMLISNDKVEPRYVEAIKKQHKAIGPYYVLAPKIAMPHARPEDGVNESALQLTVFKSGVDFESEDNGDVFLSLTLAAIDSNSHINTIMALSELFQNDDDINVLINANEKDDIIEVLKRY